MSVRLARPYTILKAAVSLDGFIDDSSPERLILSNELDFANVDAVRAGCDAIAVGANTIRRDDPRLMIKDPALVKARIERGAPPHPIKVTFTASGDLSPNHRFFTEGQAEKIVFCLESPADPHLPTLLGGCATVITMVDLGDALKSLQDRGVARLLVEGGSHLTTQFVQGGLFDEIQLSIAPFFLLDPGGIPWIATTGSPQAPSRRLNLESVEQVGDMAYLVLKP